MKLDKKNYQHIKVWLEDNFKPIYIMSLCGVISLIISLVYFNQNNNFILYITISILLMLVPFFIDILEKTKYIEELEKNFPNLLRNLSHSLSSGISPIKAIKSISNSQYGPVKKELDKIYTHMLFGLSLEEAFNKFKERIKSNLIKQGVLILVEALKSGGKIERIFSVIADSYDLILKTRKDRETMLKTYILVIYVVFFLFVGVLILLLNTMIPTLSEKGPDIQKMMGINTVVLTKYDYRNIFLNLCIIQGIFSGIMIGMMVYSKVNKGIIHSIILTVIPIIAFTLLAPIEDPVKIIKQHISSGNYGPFQVYLNKDILSKEIEVDKPVFFKKYEKCKICDKNIFVSPKSIRVKLASTVYLLIEEKEDKYIIHVSDSKKIEI